MRFIIYGAGGIGGTIGARLHMAGFDVQLIARGEHGRVLQRDGLHFIAPGINERLRIATVLTPADLTWSAQDVVLLCMKSQHTLSALDDLIAAGGRDLPVVCAQNGVANERMVLRRMQRVYAMLVFLPGAHLQPGQVITNAHDAAGVLDTGCFPTGIDALVTDLTRALSAAGFSAEPDPNIMRKKYAKLLTNMANSLSALTDMAPGSEAIVRELRAEALACYAAAGIDFADKDEASAMIARTSMVPMAEYPRAGGSSWQSAVRGTGNIEADYLNGEICLLGRLHGIPTPANYACQHLAQELAREHGAPGSVTVEQVRARIAAAPG